MRVKLALIMILILGIMFLPVTVFLAIGMIPTIVALITDRTMGKNKTVCVGAMNFSGCFPYLLKFWTEPGGQTVENALHLIANPETIIVIYLLAAGGYAIERSVTGITANLIIQKMQKRVKSIEKEQEEMVEQWGEKVTGRYALDEYGFPVDDLPSMRQEVKENPQGDDMFQDQ